MRLAYADPPYPGMAHLYPEKTEVDHAELIERLGEYDGWALSTDERSLSYVLDLCPRGTRVLAWCKSNAPAFNPNPIYSWEPVLLWPARVLPVTTRSYMVCHAPTGFLQRESLPGQKPVAFCEWVIRCLGAERDDDTLADLFPGTGIMARAWESFVAQPPLFQVTASRSHKAQANFLRRVAEPLEGMDHPEVHDERVTKVDRGKGARSKKEQAA